MRRGPRELLDLQMNVRMLTFERREQLCCDFAFAAYGPELQLDFGGTAARASPGECGSGRKEEFTA